MSIEIFVGFTHSHCQGGYVHVVRLYLILYGNIHKTKDFYLPTEDSTGKYGNDHDRVTGTTI